MRTSILSIGLFATVLILLGGCGRHESSRSEQRTDVRQQALRNRFPDATHLPVIGLLEFTVDSQRSIAAFVGRAIIADISMIDLVERDGKLWLEGHAFPHYFVRLSISEDQIGSVRRNAAYARLSTITVVFRLVDVQAPVVKLRSQIKDLTSPQSDVQIEADGLLVVFGDFLQVAEAGTEG